MTSSGFQGAMVPIQTGNPTNLGLPTPNASSAIQLAAPAVPNNTTSAGAASDTSSHKTDNLTAAESRSRVASAIASFPFDTPTVLAVARGGGADVLAGGVCSDLHHTLRVLVRL
jgi:hypothetical protein